MLLSLLPWIIAGAHTHTGMNLVTFLLFIAICELIISSNKYVIVATTVHKQKKHGNLFF